jgi:S-DNA-T family DNA segregation ATPase FtsK/SpoIIIE
MARRVSTPRNAPTKSAQSKEEATKSATQKDFFLNIKDFIKSSRFQLSIGFILSALSIMLVIAFFSFFFTGTEDQSIVSNIAERQAKRTEIENALGLPGAIVANWLVNGTFGIVSLVALVTMALYSVPLQMKISKRHYL